MGSVRIDRAKNDASFRPSRDDLGLVEIPSLMHYVDSPSSDNLPRVTQWPGRGLEVKRIIQIVARMIATARFPDIWP
jgi:hypothetical protein